MSDGSAPVAPVVATPPAANTPPSPEANPAAELEAALKKAGGFKVKAGGKEHVIDSLEKATRLLSRGIPVEEGLSQLAKEREELSPVRQMFERMKAGDLSAMEEMLDSGKLDSWAEQRLRKHYEKEKAQEGMSARERELAAALEQERGEKTKLDAERKKTEAAKAQAEEAQQLNAVRGHIETNVIATLRMLDLPDKLAPIAVDFMKPIIRASLNAGVGLDPATLADKVRPVLQQLFEYQTRNVDGEKLLSLFGDDVGRKYRAALLGRLKPGATQAPPAAPGTAESQQKEAPWDPRRMR